jgi:hypothetical protein
VKAIPPFFFGLMSRMIKRLLTGCALVMLAITVPIKAEPQGFMEGHLKIISVMQAGESDEMPRPGILPQSYAEYPLVVLSQEGKKEVAQVTADEKGNYRVALPPGAYVLDMQKPAAKRAHAKPQPFKVVSNQTVRVDMTIVIGFR